MNATTLAKYAVEKVYFVDKYRDMLLRPLILDALIEMADSISSIDRTPTHTLLSDVGTQLASLLDQNFLLTALAKHFKAQNRLHEPYSKLMNNLITSSGGNQQALNNIINDNISLHQTIQNEISKFVNNINLMAERVKKDIISFPNDSTETWCNSLPKTTGIIKLEIAGRFSFNGGKRIIILTLDNHKKIVYKPRDIRIEAKLVGFSGKISEAINISEDTDYSFIELINELLKENTGEYFTPLSTYQFMLRHDEQGHYGYVEYLNCGTEEDNSFTHEQAQKLYRQLGQLSGIALIIGLYDLLPCNVRISGKNAYFTDSDIAFELGILRIFNDELNNICPINTPPDSLKRTLLPSFWQHNLNNIRPLCLYVVENDKIIPNTRLSYSNKTRIIATENIVYVVNRGSNCNLDHNTSHKNIHTYYAADVKQGLQNIFSLFKNNTHGSKRIKNFITSLSGLYVRHFPFLVLSSLLQKIYTDYIYDYPDPDKLFEKINQEINKIIYKKQKNDIKYPNVYKESVLALHEAIYDSLKNGDYFYITQKLGEYALHYKNIPLSIPSDAINKDNYFKNCSLMLANEIIDTLSKESSQESIDKFINCYANYIQSIAMPSLPPLYATLEFTQSIGVGFAKKLGFSR